MYNVDNMEHMKRTPDNYYDIGIVDPPYFDGPNKRMFYGCKVSPIGVKRVYKKIKTWEIPDKKYFNELMRVCKYYIVWGCNYFDYKFHSGRIVWDKVNGSSSFSPFELAATNLFDHTRKIVYMWNGMMQGKGIDEGHIQQGNKSLNEIRIHPTQKPVNLYKIVLREFVKKDYKVLDTHGGSGTLCHACHDMGYDIDWCELDKDVFSDAMEWYRTHISQLTMF